MFLAAADKLDDFVTIASGDARFWPFRPRQNFEISLNRHAPGVQTEIAEQIRDGSLNTRRS